MPDLPTDLTIPTRHDGPVTVPVAELDFTTSRSSGPGGQHVNKTETRVTLVFDLDATHAFTDDQKALIRDHLATRLTKAGLLKVTAQAHRSQAANRDLAIERFADLLEQALNPDPKRKKTRVPKRSKRRRLENKKKRSETKKLRKTPKIPR